MATATPNSLLDALRQHRLLDLKQLEELNSLHFPDPKSLAKELIGRGWLTPYQANQLLNGKGHELFLGSYILLERLGEGGMGQVFKARHRNLGRISALKLIRKERLDNPSAVRRFQREVRSAAALSHPNIVLAYDADEIAGTHLLVMEFIEGATDLAKLVKKKGPLPVDRAREYIRQAALGLQHAYERGMVHRDIKPANLLLTTDAKVVKVLDMGLARLDQPADDEDTSTTMTKEGAVMGTPDYIAPEQALDTHRVDIRADIYSLGCTLYYLLTGRVPFPGGSLLQKLKKHESEEPPAVEKLRPEVPPQLAGVVRKMMAKKPQERYQTPAEVALALAEHNAGSGLPVPALANDQTFVESSAVVSDGSRDSLASAFAYIDKRSDTVAYDSRQALPKKPRNRRGLVIGVGTGLAALVGLAVLPFLIPSSEKKQPEKRPAPAVFPKKLPPVPTVPGSRFALAFGGNETGSRVVIPSWKYQGGHPLTVEVWTVLQRPLGSIEREILVGNPEWAGFGLCNGPAHKGAVPTGDFSFFLKERNNYVVCCSKEPLPRDQLIHLAGVYDDRNNEVRLFVNGKLQGRVPAPGAHQPSPFDCCLGANPDGGGKFSEHFLGRLNEVRISKVARYDDDFTPAKRFEPDKDTLALYHFDEGAGDVLKDSSGNKHHGTIVGAKWMKADGKPIPAFTNTIGMEFALVPKGKAWLGGGDGKVGDAEVDIPRDFYLGIYEVTQEEWVKVMGPDQNPSSFSRTGKDRDAVKNIGDAELKRFPVESVSWWQCQEFLKRLNEIAKKNGEPGGWEYRLPKDAEWEYACRGGPGQKKEDYGFSYYVENGMNTLPGDRANFAPTGLKRPCKVGSYPPNRLGLFDMHGNVREWCNDPHDMATDQKGLTFRAERGGGWNNTAPFCKAAYLPRLSNWDWRNDLGLRVARVPVGMSPPEGKAVDLLGMIDLNRDVVQGGWAFRGKKLVTVGGGSGVYPRLVIPYAPGPEYQIEMEVKRTEAEGQGLNIGFPIGQRQAMVVIDGWAQPTSGLETIDKKNSNTNETTHKGRLLPQDQITTVVLQVRKKEVIFLCAGRTVFKWQGDPARLELHPVWAVPNPRSLFLGSQAVFHIHKMTLTPLGPTDSATTAQPPGPWRPLLDRDLSKWQKPEENKPAAITVDEMDKELVLRLKRGSKQSYLWVKEWFQDYHWRMEFRFPGKEAGKLAIFWAQGRFGFHLASDGKVSAAAGKTVTVNGGVLKGNALVSRGALKNYVILGNADLQPAGAWNRLDLVRVGNSLALFVNGRFVGALMDIRWPIDGKETEFLGKTTPGTLQSYGEVLLRRIEIRDISAFQPELIEPGPWQPLLDENLTHFNQALKKNKPGDITAIKIDNESVMRVKGEGRPYVTSKLAMQNGHLRLEFQTPDNGFGQFAVGYGFPGGKAGILFHIATTGKASVYSFGVKTNDAVLERGGIVTTGKPNPADTSFNLADASLEPPGKWNRLDFVRVDDRIAFFVNGRFLGAVAHLRAVIDGKEIEYGNSHNIHIHGAGDKGKSLIRRIEVRDIAALPPELLAPGPWEELLAAKDLSKWEKVDNGQIDAFKFVETEAEPVLALRKVPKEAYIWSHKTMRSNHVHMDFKFPGKEPTTMQFAYMLPFGKAGLFFHLNNLGAVWGVTYAPTKMVPGILERGLISASGEKILKGVAATLEPAGAWNRLDLVRVDDGVAIFINGRFVTAFAGIRRGQDGKEIDFGKTTFNLKCQSGEVWVRQLQIRDITALPPELLAPGPWRSLFNGKDLRNWFHPKDAKPEEYGVVTADGEPAITVSDPKGRRIRINGDFDYYHLRLQFRKEGPADLGMAVNLVEKSGVKGGLSFLVNSKSVYLHRAETNRYHVATLDGDQFKAGPLAEQRWFFKHVSIRPAGQWNDLEIVRMGDSGVIRLNGQLAGAFTGFRFLDGGVESVPGKSAIAFQATSGKLLLRHIEIRDIGALPPDLLAPGPW